tara:strand:+ start:205 stop:783 length:579 start_codon:yes stop_codon:yes gene_type:complete
MLKKTKKLTLNSRFLKFLLIPTILISTPFFHNIREVEAGLEFQWEQNTGYKRLKWFQKEKTKSFKNTIYFFLRPGDRKDDLLKIDLAIPKSFKTKITNKNISLCRVNIGGFESRTKCLEDIPVDIEIKNEESSLKKINIYPLTKIPTNKDSYAIVLKAKNPKRSGLYQFHSYGQPAGKASSSYLGSWTIVLD